MSQNTSEAKVHKAGTVESLLSELEKLPIIERRGYIEDWLIHFAPSNPLFEETEDSEQLSCTLFVNEKSIDTWRNLYLVGDSFGWDEPQFNLEKIKNTSWWYISINRLKGSQLHYLFSPNEVGTLISPHERLERRKNWFFDPRNKINVETVERTHSVLQFPGYCEIPEISADRVPFSSFRVPKKLEGNRTIQIASFTQNGETPEHLLVLHDGESLIKHLQIDRQIQQGVIDGRWPSMVVLSLSISPEDRRREYDCNNTKYPDFIADSAVPALEEELSITFDPKNTTLLGTSIGGWGAFDVVWNRNDRIKNVICHSSPWWWTENEPNYFLNTVQDSKKERIDKIYLDCGIYETGRKPLSTYDSNVEFTNILKKKKYNYMARELMMGHRYHSWKWALSGGFDFIFNDERHYGPLPGREMHLS